MRRMIAPGVWHDEGPGRAAMSTHQQSFEGRPIGHMIAGPEKGTPGPRPLASSPDRAERQAARRRWNGRPPAP